MVVISFNPWTLLVVLGILVVFTGIWNLAVDCLEETGLLGPTVAVLIGLAVCVWLSWMNYIPSVQS